MRVSNVLYHVALPFTLLSVRVFGLKGYRSMFDATEASIIRKSTGKVVAEGLDINTAHRRLGHLFEGHLRRIPQVSEGLNFSGTFQFCEECSLAEQTRRNFTSHPKHYTNA
ncbi:MAG: hypothetical protein Q9221_008740 [Calogaya cf. arnoldii]